MMVGLVGLVGLVGHLVRVAVIITGVVRVEMGPLCGGGGGGRGCSHLPLYTSLEAGAGAGAGAGGAIRLCLTSPGSCTLGLSFCFLLTTQTTMLTRRMTATTERLMTRIRTKGDSGVRDSDSARKYLMKLSPLLSSDYY